MWSPDFRSPELRPPVTPPPREKQEGPALPVNRGYLSWRFKGLEGPTGNADA